MTERHCLHGNGELLAYIPYQLGFTPTDSVVVVGFDDDNVISVVVRFDPLTPDEAVQTRDLFAVGRLARLASATVIAYGSMELVGSTLSSLVDAVAGAQVAVGDRLHVFGDRWRALTCVCGRCPTGSAALPAADSAPVLHAIMDGVDPRRRRADIEAFAEPTPAERDRAVLVEAVWHEVDYLDDDYFIDILFDVVGGGPATLDPEEIVDATATLDFPQVRDVLLSWLIPSAFPSEAVQPHLLRRWIEVAGTSPGPQALALIRGHLVRWACTLPQHRAANVWSCVAAVEWARGGGAMATIGVERALRAEPAHRLAHLVYECLRMGVLPPGPSLIGGLDAAATG